MLSPSTKSMLRPLCERFGVSFIFSRREAPTCDIVKLCHRTPSIQVGSINRTLLFPHRVTSDLRSRWPRRRGIRFGFAGLVTQSRSQALSRWLGTHFGLNVEVPITPNGSRLASRIASFIGVEAHPSRLRFGELQLRVSQGGRQLKRKAWDDGYYKELLETKFQLCPNGDFIWTYRFFEAILCGAIPIVEDDCGAYDGFHFYRMSDDPRSLDWSPELVMHNYTLAVDRLTVSHSDIRAQIMGEYQ